MSMYNGSTSVLLVDDDKVDREMVQRLLKNSQLASSVIEANTVDEGLAAFRKQRFDVVLLDYRMPTRNGNEMIVELRNNFVHNGCAIIVLSTSEEEQLASKCIKLGAQDMIVKSELTVNRIKTAIKNARARYDLEQQQKSLYLEAKKAAESDLLTGLPNRFVFDEALSSLLSIGNNNHKVALILFDIDNFKAINDLYGHNSADELLVELSKRINDILHGHKMFSRIHGDEFGILFSEIKNTYSLSLLAKQIIDSSKDLRLNNSVVNLSVSVGVAINSEGVNDHKELIKSANIALYRAKEERGSHFCFFYPHMKKQLLRRYEIEKKLANAVKSEELLLLYQPIINLKSKEVIGFEALVRFNNNLTLQSYPDEFVPIAEETGAILDIGMWVIDKALGQLAYWRSLSGKRYTMAINLSVTQLKSRSLVCDIKHKLEEYNVSPSLLEFEITETAIFDCTQAFIDKIEAIRELGCNVALDDFGTGFSSISHLMKLPITTVKLDKSIMPHEDESGKKKLLLEALILMVNKLDLDIVAEGIEEPYHLAYIEKFAVNRAQGYLFKKPITAKEIEKTYFLL